MLTRNAIAAAFPLAQMLAAKGIVLSAANITPVEQLVNLTLPQAQLLVDQAGQLESTPDFANALEAASKAELPDGSVPHDSTKQALIQAAKVAVSGTLHAAQNVVSPMIKRVAEDVENFIDSDATLASKPMSIVPIFYKEIWNSSVLETLAGNHAGQYSNDLTLRPLNAPAPADWVEYLSIGVPSIDGELAKFVQECAPEFLDKIWKETFGPRAGQLSSVLNAPLGEPGGAYARADAAIIVFLAARKMSIAIPDGLNIDLGVLRAYLAELSARGGQAIMATVGRRQRDIERGLVVVSLPNGPSGDIYVLGDTYNVFLSNGGSPEAVFGAVLLQQTAAIRPQPKAEELVPMVAEWKGQLTLIQRRIELRRDEVMLQAMRQSISKIIAEAPAGLLVRPAAEHQERLVQAIQALKNVDSKHLWQTIRHLVCTSMFAHTDVEQLLIGIDRACESNPNMDIREVALLATTDYVVDWLCGQQVHVGSFSLS